MNDTMEGGCFCNAIRYRVTGEPALSLLCFCSDCLASYGCDGFPGLMVENNAFQQVAGSTTEFARSSASGRTVVKHFCSTCGTTIWGQTELGLVSISAGTLDDPNRFRPTKAVFTDQAPHWARIPDHLEKA